MSVFLREHETGVAAKTEVGGDDDWETDPDFVNQESIEHTEKKHVNGKVKQVEKFYKKAEYQDLQKPKASSTKQLEGFYEDAPVSGMAGQIRPKTMAPGAAPVSGSGGKRPPAGKRPAGKSARSGSNGKRRGASKHK